MVWQFDEAKQTHKIMIAFNLVDLAAEKFSQLVVESSYQSIFVVDEQAVTKVA